MRDVMQDLETLGTRPGSVILSLGAVAFDPDTGSLGEAFYSPISLRSCLDTGLAIDTSTLNWWSRQSTEAAKVIFAALDPHAPTLSEVLEAFSLWLRENAEAEPRLWGNGSDFDNTLLSAAYSAAGLIAPWKFWNSRCFRTLKAAFDTVPEPAREGTHHNALDDARHQARHALAIAAARRSQPASV